MIDLVEFAYLIILEYYSLSDEIMAQVFGWWTRADLDDMNSFSVGLEFSIMSNYSSKISRRAKSRRISDRSAALNDFNYFT